MDPESEAEGLLSVRAAEASEFEPGITITPRLCESRSISQQLVELSRAATLLVVGVAPARPRADHGLLGPVEDRVVVHAHCPVVTVNGPGPIVGQDYDKIVLGWTEGTTGRRGAGSWSGGGRTKRIATQRRHCFTDSCVRAGGSYRTSERRASANRVSPSDREQSPRSADRCQAQRWSRCQGVAAVVGSGRPCSCWALITVSRHGASASGRSPRS